MLKKFFMSLVFLFCLLCTTAYAMGEVDSGWEARYNQRWSKYEEAWTNYENAEYKYNLYYNRSNNLKEIEDTYKNYNIALTNLNIAEKRIEAYFYDDVMTGKNVYSFSLPAKVEAYVDDDIVYDSLSWYKWDQKNRCWVWISNAEHVYCHFWYPGYNAIKLIKNNDPNNYMIRSYNVSVTGFDISVYGHSETIETYHPPVGVMPFTLQLTNTSIGYNTLSWYVWSPSNNDWLWFSNDDNPVLTVWELDDDGYATIKLVKNNDPNDYAIRYVCQDYVEFRIKKTDGTDVTNKIDKPTDYPAKYKLSLIDMSNSDIDWGCDEYKSVSWYIWDITKGDWTWVSNRFSPEITLWYGGENTIKMVKNGDPYNYCCKTIDVQFGVN